MIDYSKFKKSLKQLELQFKNYQNIKTRQELNDLDCEGIAESVIQRFKTCYDCLWKILKRYLNEGLSIPEVPNSPKPILRLANENKSFTAGIEQWLKYAAALIETSHDYSDKKAQTCIKLMQNFINDTIDLYQIMTGETWN